MLSIEVVKRWDPRLKQKEIRSVLRRIWKLLAAHWHKKFLKRHFTVEGAKTYGYKWPRTEKYTRDKRRKFGHNLPLVYTGLLRDKAKAPPRITATVKRATLRMSAPDYVYKYHKYIKQQERAKRTGSGKVYREQPNKYAEMIAVSPREIVELKRIAKARIRKWLGKQRKGIRFGERKRAARR